MDINQPVDKESNTLKDTTRIKGCVPTIKELSDKGAKLVILAHQGSDIEYQKLLESLAARKNHQRAGIGKDVQFVPDVCGPYAQNKIQ